jgi:LAO/AO transport system kinase
VLRAHAKVDLEGLVAGVVQGKRLMVARALRLVDDAPAVGRKLASLLHPHRRVAKVIGVTGNPGAGKSTVVDALIAAWRGRGQRVAVLAVDPSSPFSGGAILGDRIRMNRHFADDGVFIRSLATRGSLGGLSRATFDSVRVLDAAGFDVIVVETVGVGQDEVDIARLAHSTLVVMVPGMGDDVQAIKAGILEIADVFLINKADKEGVPQLERSLRQMMALVPAHAAWEPPIVKSVASQGVGIDEVIGRLEAHDAYLTGPEGKSRQRMRNLEIFNRLLDAALVEQGRKRLAAALRVADARVADADADPFAEVVRLVGDD